MGKPGISNSVGSVKPKHTRVEGADTVMPSSPVLAGVYTSDLQGHLTLELGGFTIKWV